MPTLKVPPRTLGSSSSVRWLNPDRIARSSPSDQRDRRGKKRATLRRPALLSLALFGRLPLLRAEQSSLRGYVQSVRVSQSPVALFTDEQEQASMTRWQPTRGLLRLATYLICGFFRQALILVTVFLRTARVIIPRGWSSLFAPPPARAIRSLVPFGTEWEWAPRQAAARRTRRAQAARRARSGSRSSRGRGSSGPDLTRSYLPTWV